jgi:hypothetical protein
VRLEHIGRYDRVKVECACGHTVLLSLDAFSGLTSDTRIIDLKRRLRCDSRGEKGRVMVSVVWADYSARRG